MLAGGSISSPMIRSISQTPRRMGLVRFGADVNRMIPDVVITPPSWSLLILYSSGG